MHRHSRRTRLAQVRRDALSPQCVAHTVDAEPVGAPPRPSEDHRLGVAVAAQGERYQALLRAYLNGPGRGMFVVTDVAEAQALIADHDHPVSRAEMRRFLTERRRPVIVLASRDPAVPGTVWVRKPVDFDTLAVAAHRVWAMLSTTPSPAPAAWRWLPRSVGGGPLADRAGDRQREEPGPYRMPPRDDWTTKIACTALGALGIAALASLLGWRPAAESWRPSAQSMMRLESASDPAQRGLEQAVALSLMEPRRLSPGDRQAIDAQLREQAQLKALPEIPAGFQFRGYGDDVPMPAPTALPVDQLAEAPGGGGAATEVQRALREGVAASVAATGRPRH